MPPAECLLCGSESPSPCPTCGTGGDPFFPRAFWGPDVATRYGAPGGVEDLASTGALAPRSATPPPPPPEPEPEPPAEAKATLAEAGISKRTLANLEARQRALDRREGQLEDWERLLKQRSEETPPPELEDLAEPAGEEEAEGRDPTVLAVGCLEEGDLEGAASWFRQAAHEGDASAWMNLAETLISLDRPEDALQAYDAAIVRDPTDMAALMAKFSLHVTLHSLVQAVATARLLFKLDPEATRHVAEIAGALMQEGRREDAVTLYNTILEEEPDHPVVHAMLGILLSEMGDTEAAEDHVAAALEHDPEGELGWFAKGILLNAQGRWGAAVQHIDRALAIRWDFPEAWMAKGEIHIGMGNHGEAADCFRRVLENRPRDPKATFGLAESLAKLGRRKEALAVLDRMEEAEEDDESATLLKAMLEAHDDDEDLGELPASRPAPESRGDSEAWLMKGKALMDMGETGKAVECFNHVLEMEPEHEAAREWRSECLAALQTG